MPAEACMLSLGSLNLDSEVRVERWPEPSYPDCSKLEALLPSIRRSRVWRRPGSGGGGAPWQDRRGNRKGKAAQKEAEAMTRRGRSARPRLLLC